MMTKRLLCMLLVCLLALSACAPVQTPIVEATLVPRADTAVPDVTTDESLAVHGNATLYFRYLNEPCLAPESRTITQLPGQSFELALLHELLAGPGTRSTDRSGLFPAGVHVLSTFREGRTLFVTLSEEIMNAYADEPIDWQEQDLWRREVPLRRLLCMQSIVATITENCNIDQVQILVQSAGSGSIQRLKQNYYMDDSEDDVLTVPLRRNASMLLTADTTLRLVLTAWQTKAWQRLYLYVAARDHETGLDRPAYRDFVTAMEVLPSLTAYEPGAGSVSADGAATYAVDVSVLTPGGQVQEARDRVLHLVRENGMWKISLSQLTGWLEE